MKTRKEIMGKLTEVKDYYESGATGSLKNHYASQIAILKWVLEV